MPVSRSVIDAIGETPLVELSRFAHVGSARLLAKLENLNPGASKKDRIARQIIEDAENDGTLRPGQAVVEMTSGNTGTGLAIVCGVKRYPFIAVMSSGNSEERIKMMRALGAEVVLVDQKKGGCKGEVSGDDLALVDAATAEIVAQRKAFRADQFHHQGNFRAHYLHTAREIISQSSGEIDVFCDFAGSGGTFAGCAAALKEFNRRIQCFVVEPESSPFLAGGIVSKPGHRIQGGGYSMQLPMLRREDIDGFLTVTDDEAIKAARELARTEGIFAGFSTGANLAAARKLLQPGKTVVTLVNDSGLKYLSTGLWN